MRLTFTELAESFHYKGLELTKCKKGYTIYSVDECIRFSNLTEAGIWLENFRKELEVVTEELAEVDVELEVVENQETIEQEDMQDSPNIQSELNESFIPEQLPYVDKEVVKKILLAKHFYCVGYSDDSEELPLNSEYQPDFTTAENVGGIYGWNILTSDVAIFAEIDGFYYGKFLDAAFFVANEDSYDDMLTKLVDDLKTFIADSIIELVHNPKKVDMAEQPIEQNPIKVIIAPPIYGKPVASNPIQRYKAPDIGGLEKLGLGVDKSTITENEYSEYTEPMQEVEKINPLVIEFSHIKKAVNFFSQFREKNQNTIKIDNQGFYYLDNWYSACIDIQNEIILNFDNLKDFVGIFPGSDDSKILLDVENSLIRFRNFQHSIAVKTATETYENYNISDFYFLTQIKSDTLAKVLSAASINKREKELQVLNFKFTNTDLKVACTNSSQIFSYKLKADLDNFDSLRNIDLQIDSEIAIKFSKLATYIDILHFDNVICIVAGSHYKFTVQEEREFFDYTSFIFENTDISWHTKFLNPLFQFLKKLKRREEYSSRFTNQGNNCLFEVISNQGVVYSGKFLQKDCKFSDFSVTADLFYNLLANIQEFSRLTISLNDGYLVAKVLDSRYDFILNLMD